MEYLDWNERLKDYQETQEDRMEVLQKQLENAISECDSRQFLEAYAEAMYWVQQARGWGGSIDQDIVFDFRYKTLPNLKDEFDGACECRSVK